MLSYLARLPWRARWEEHGCGRKSSASAPRPVVLVNGRCVGSAPSRTCGLHALADGARRRLYFRAASFSEHITVCPGAMGPRKRRPALSPFTQSTIIGSRKPDRSSTVTRS